MADMEAENSESGYPGGSERILFVDDEASLVEVFEEMLDWLGYQIDTAMNGADALEIFKADPRRFDLIITDQNMPDITGEQLAGELTAVRPDIPVIICTGFSDEISRETAEKSGVREFIQKPIEMRQLAKMIRQVLDQA